MSIAQAKRFTLDEYHRLTELGFFHEDDHIELVNGEIIEMVSKGKAHETCLRNLWKLLPKLVEDRATLQSQAPITIPLTANLNRILRLLKTKMIIIYLPTHHLLMCYCL